MNRTEFLHKLKLVKPIVSQNDIIPSFRFFLLEKDKLRVGNSFQSANIAFDSGIDGLIDPDTIIKLLSTYTSDELSLRQIKDKAHFIIGKNSSISMSIQPKDNFVFEDPDYSGIGVAIKGEFITGIKKVMFSVNKDGYFPINRGVIFTGDNFYSTDCGERMSKYELSGEKSDSVLLPELFCKSLLSFYETFGEGHLFINDDTVVAKFSDENYITSVIDRTVDFLEFDDIFSDAINKCSSIKEKDSNELVDILKRHVLLTGTSNRFTEVDFDDGAAAFTTKSVVGRVDDELKEFPLFGMSTVNFKVEPKLLLSGLRNIESFMFSADEDSVVFVGTDTNFTHIISSVSS